MQNQTFKIYRDGRFSRWETYGPVLQDKLVVLGNKVDYWFTHYGAWPTNNDLLQ